MSSMGMDANSHGALRGADRQNDSGGNHVVLFLWLGEKGGVQASSAPWPACKGTGRVAALTLHFAIGQEKYA